MDEIDSLKEELQKKVKAHTKILREKEEVEKENEEQKKQIKRLTSAIEVNGIFWAFPWGFVCGIANL